MVVRKLISLGGLLCLLFCAGCDLLPSSTASSEVYQPPDISEPTGQRGRVRSVKTMPQPMTKSPRSDQDTKVVESDAPLYDYEPRRPIVEDFTFVNCVGIKMIWIKPGEFMMGRPSPHKRPRSRINATWPVRRVVVEQGFWIAETEVTQRQYGWLASQNPSKFKGKQNPVDSISWSEAMNFCRLMTERECEARRLSQRDFLFEYTLPSEAQWEYACRAGTKGIYYGPNLRDLAWFGLNTPDRKSQPVKGKKANPWGLYDMLGNVEEWCLDYFHHDYYGAPNDGTARLRGESVRRSIRGGSWQTRRGKTCSCSSRSGGGPSYSFPTVGFRPILIAKERRHR